MNSDDFKRIFDKVSRHMQWGPAKTEYWFSVNNPNLGNVTPMHLIRSGRIEKLEKWIDSCIDEAGDPKGILKEKII